MMYIIFGTALGLMELFKYLGRKRRGELKGPPPEEETPWD